MSILIIAFESDRWGPARLPEHLTKHGLKISALCPLGNVLSNSSFVSELFILDNVKSLRYFCRRLSQAMTAIDVQFIIPSDERVVVALHMLVKHQLAGRKQLGDSAFNVVLRSLGDPKHYDDLLLKHKTLTLARKIGILAPIGTVVKSVAQAKSQAKELGFPIYLKTSFSWAGLGAIKCETEAELQANFTRLSSKPKWHMLRKSARWLLSRDWYPTTPVIEIQNAIDGKPAMFCGLAWQGELLAGFAGKPTQTNGETGPSTVVLIEEDFQLEAVARKLIAATAASGFLGFDFVVDEKTVVPFLLECNPRPIQICHLGEKIGVDLLRTLRETLAGEPLTGNNSGRLRRTIPLFPQEWLRDEQSALGYGPSLDAPLADKKLMDFMLQAGKLRGRSIERLQALLYPLV